MSTLAQLAADLEYAAGTGASRLSAEVVNTGQQRLNMGQALATSPGLTQLRTASSHTARAQGAQVDVGAVADAMATELADGGAALASGRRA